MSKRLVLYALREIRERLGTTLFIATHDRDLASSAARLFEIDNGLVREK